MKRLTGPGGSWFNRATACLLAVWITHAVLRMAFLFRKDAFGFPIVGKPDWYILHAFFLDLHWIFLWSLPFLLLLTLAARFAPRGCPPLFGLLLLFHAVALVFTVIDHETLRFMGTHFDPGFAKTYGNTAAIQEVFHFLAADKSIKGLPYLLLFGSIPCAIFLYRILLRSSWAQSPNWSLKPVAWILGGCLAGYLYLYVIWPGGFRMAKLRPVVQSAYLWSSRDDGLEISADSLSYLSSYYQGFWRKGSADTNWTFPRPDYPYYREPAGKIEAGAEEKPWNFVMLVLESHRALNVGHLKPYGAPDSATPFLDSLAHAGHFWTRMMTSGLPTINALISIHLSVPPHPTRLISSDFTALNHRAFTSILARHDYTTRFFSAADPAWDNQTPWLRQWYGGITYDRSRENDGDMFSHMARWMKDSLQQGRPFFVTAMTKTNHYPFNPVPGVKRVASSASLTERMNATMAYTDSCLRAFVNSLRSQPWFDHTVFVIIGDHGFPLGEHGSSTIGYGLYTENVWIPLVMAGAHPKLGLSRGHDDLAAHIDLGPTLLELAGIREPNSFMGHSLLFTPPRERQFTLCLHNEQAALEHGAFRWHGAWGSTPREQGDEIFDVIQDRLEKQNLLEGHRALRDSLFSISKNLTRLHIQVVEKNRLWPDSL